jgi:hypothetical protein
MDWIESKRCGRMEVEKEISDSMQSKSKVLLVYSISMASVYLFPLASLTPINIY